MRYLIQDFLKKGDMVLLFLCVLASTFGMALLYSATNYWNDPSRWEVQSRALIVQGAATAIGIVLYIILSALDFRSLMESCWKFVLVFNVLFLLLLLTDLGTSNNSGNRNWLEIPGFPVEIQPNEIVKISYILLTGFLMSKIQEKGNNLNHIPSLFQVGCHTLLTIGLVAVICGDWGMCVIYACITLVMLWAAGLHVAWFVGGFSIVGVAIHIVWTYYLPFTSYWDENYIVRRFRSLLDRSYDVADIGWQQTRSLLAIGSGKFFGQGYMQGMQTQSTSPWSLPARHTDFIFSVCGEELGFLGCLVLLMLLVSIVLRCVWIAQRVDSFFSAYVAMGTAGMLLAQITFNVGMCLFILPTMGLTLPFISYGGSSIVTLYASMGVVSSLRSRNLPSWIRDRGQL